MGTGAFRAGSAHPIDGSRKGLVSKRCDMREKLWRGSQHGGLIVTRRGSPCLRNLVVECISCSCPLCFRLVSSSRRELLFLRARFGS